MAFRGARLIEFQDRDPISTQRIRVERRLRLIEVDPQHATDAPDR